VKVINKSGKNYQNEKTKAKMLTQARLEIELMERIHSPYSLRLFAHFEDDNNFFLLLEYCNYGTLSEFVKVYSRKNRSFLEEDEARVVMKKIISGLQHV